MVAEPRQRRFRSGRLDLADLAVAIGALACLVLISCAATEPAAAERLLVFEAERFG